MTTTDSKGEKMSRIRDNAAAAAGRRTVAAARARDLEAMSDLYAAGYSEEVEGPDSQFKTSHRDQVLASLQGLFQLPGFTLQIESLATLGPSLDLHRTTVRASVPGPDGEPLRIEMVSVGEANPDNRYAHLDAYLPAHMAQAIERLYERYAASLKPGQGREAALRAGSFDEIKKALVSQGQVTPGAELSVGGVLALEGDGHVLLYVADAGDGAAANQFIALVVIQGGQIAFLESFQPDEEPAALGRFDQVRGSAGV
jgi:hypothetical protein